MNQAALYSTKIVNEDGIQGQSIVIEPEHFAVQVSSPTKVNQVGTNPEQLLGLALVTCLNATIEAEEKRRGYAHQAKVTADVSLHHDNPGYQFLVKVSVEMPHLENSEAQAIFDVSLTRCPVVKLLQHSNHVTYQFVERAE